MTQTHQTQTLYVAVDDTDDISKATSTGRIAELIVRRLDALGGRLIHDITRHQLLLDPRVPYTSHNSAMVAKAEIPCRNIELFREQAIAVIKENMADSADPGLCFACLPADRKNGLYRRQRRDLIDFGNAAVRVYCSQQNAYALAAEIPWVTLSAHGGNGQGVVGALAGIGLRLSGNNGRFRGSVDLLRVVADDSAQSGKGDKGDKDDKRANNRTGKGANKRDKVQHSDVISTAGTVCERLSIHLGGKVRVVNSAHQELPADFPIRLSSNVKAILQDHSYTIIANVQDSVANPLGKTDLDELFPKESENIQFCNDFQPDTDSEERVGMAERTCASCLYRRWQAQGFSCIASKTGKAAKTSKTIGSEKQSLKAR